MKRKNITFTMDPSIVDMFKKYCDYHAYIPSRKLELMILDLLKQQSTEQEKYVDSLLKTKRFSKINNLIKELINTKAIINIDLEDLTSILQSGSNYEVKEGTLEELFSLSLLSKKYKSVLIILECQPKFYLNDAQILMDKITGEFESQDLNFVYAAKTNPKIKKPIVNLLLVS